MNAIHTILLAAGMSMRHPGKLLRYIDGVPAVVRSARSLIKAGLLPHIVVGHNSDLVESCLVDHLGDSCVIVHNTEYGTGMASSIRAGVRAAPEDAEAILLHLADKPLVKVETVEAILKTWESLKAPILVPVHKGQNGHPVMFHTDMRDRLLSLTGDIGARNLLNDMEDKLSRLEVDDEGVLQDLDMVWEQVSE